jgi:tetratricopeptide (TPR) repeat protein
MMPTFRRLLGLWTLLVLTVGTRADIIRDPAYHVSRGDALAQKQRWPEALAEYRLALVLRPSCAEAWAGIAQVLDRDNKSQATLALDEALRADSTCSSALLMRAERSLQQGQAAEAFADLNLALRSKPNHPRALRVRGQLYLQQNQIEEALKDFSQYVAAQPNDAEAYRLRGNVYMQQGDQEKAIQDFSQVIRLDNKDVKTLLQRAKLYEASNLPEKRTKAIDDYSRAIQLEPKNSEARLSRAELLFDLQRYRECQVDIGWILQENPQHQQALLIGGLCGLRTRRYSQAVADLRKLTTLNSQHYNAWKYLGFAYESLELYPEAVQCYSRMLQLREGDGNALMYRASAYDGMDRPKEALADADAALAQASHDDSEILRVRGTILYHQDKWREAEADFAKAIEIRPHMKNYWIERANARRRLGKLEEALSDLDRALELDERSDVNNKYSGVYTKRGSFFISQGKWAEAQAAYRKLVQLPATENNEITLAYGRVLLLMLDHKYEEGWKMAEEHIRKHPKDHSWLYDMACALAIGAEIVGKEGKHPQAAELRRKLIDRTLELLQQCVTLGYRNFVHMRHDWDFNCLQGDPRFVKLSHPAATKALWWPFASGAS